MNVSDKPLPSLHFGTDAVNGRGWKLPGHVLTNWVLLSAALLAFIVRTAVQPEEETLDHLLFASSAVTCGLAWLFARSLFRKSNELAEIWPYAFVALLCGLAMLSRYSGDTHVLGLDISGAILALGSSAILVLTILEPLSGLGGNIAQSERRFRWLFLSGYALILLFGVIIVRASDASHETSLELLAQQDRIYVVCAIAALIGAALAANHRCRPLHAFSKRRTAEQARATDDATNLAMRLRDLLEAEHLYRDPDLRVETVSRILNVPSYRISRIVTSQLGFANFNRMINALRIDEARARLVDPEHASSSVMTIAFDSGFASIGPFNRAFKEQFGVTPRAYRKEHCTKYVNTNPA